MNRGPKVARPEDVIVENVSKKKLKVLMRLGRYIMKFRFGYVCAILISVVANVLALAGPKLSGRAINAIGVETGVVDFETVARNCVLMVIAYFVSSVMSYVLQVLMINLSRGIVKQMRQDVFSKLMRMKIGYFDTSQTGDIISRISYDIDTINATLSTDLVQITSSVVTVTGAFVMMMTISPLLCIVFAVTVPASIITTNLIAKKVHPYFRARSGKLGELNGYAEECLSGQKTVRAYSQEQTMIKRFAEKNKKAADAYFDADYYGSMVGPTVNFINNISLGLVSVFGSLLFLSGRILIGDVSSFVLYSRKFSGPINEAANIINELQSAAAAAERVFRLLDEEEESVNDKNITVFGNGPGQVAVAGNVRTEDVCFGYPGGREILHSLGISAKPGQTIAIVGPTGAGKTTIINLLMRFYDPDSGRIFLEDEDTKLAERTSVRKSYTMVLQDTWLFTGTIAENIAYGSTGNVTREQIEDAAKAAGIHPFITGLPKGYDTLLTDVGVNISKGQKQLLTIARALISDAPVIILDEATSNVDSMTEMRIQNAMRDLTNGKTAVIIAHRLSTVKSADVIYVLRSGRVIEYGKHEELMAAGGFYRKLYDSQFAG